MSAQLEDKQTEIGHGKASLTAVGAVGPTQLSATERLVEVAQELSLARDLDGIMRVVRRAARELTGADGATFVLRDGQFCYYADENAITPLWKGHRFPIEACISGWAMLHREAAIIEDIYQDDRIPQDAYRPTFVKSLAMVPIRTTEPVGAIGNYWASRHLATEGEIKLLRALADLTSVAMENVHLYGELQKRIQETQEAVRARDEFITIAAHELRTPLTGLQLQLQSLESIVSEEQDEDDRILERTGRAVSCVRRLDALIDGLLDVSRVNNTEIVLHLEPFDLSETVREVIRRFARSARRVGCTIKLDAVSVAGKWDRLRLEQLLTHLLSNAIKYGPGKPVEILLKQEAQTAHIEVRDQGIGIGPDIAERVFERFGRAGPVSHYAGLGLGLYLARQVVEAHGGAIRFRSRPGEGCTFIVDLPLKSRPSRLPSMGVSSGGAKS